MGQPLGLCTVKSSALVGLEPETVVVEVACCRGPAFFQLVGLAQTTVREARVRVSSALSRLGVLMEEWAITVNLAPAGLRKKEAALDLAIAVGVLGAIGRFDAEACKGWMVLGELSLNGQLQPVRGILPSLMGARKAGVCVVVVPKANAVEAGLVPGLGVRVAEDLGQVLEHLEGRRALASVSETPFEPRLDSMLLDLADVRGQSVARRALEVAAAGGHNLLMVGPPGAGKTMLARRIPGILPELSYEEALETTAVHSVAGLVEPDRGVVTVRPFRAPHHTITEQGLVGGGEHPRPGEVSLAHNGVLFLDEFPEFSRRALESLRQPLEDGKLCISRARAVATFPARPMLVAAMNPCPCGYFGHPVRPCRCTAKQRERYRARVSGPLLDRLDVHAMLPPVSVKALAHSATAEPSISVRTRVLAARERQRFRRTKGLTQARCNAELQAADLSSIVNATVRALELAERAGQQFGLSARAFGKVLRVARTAADLAGTDRVGEVHVAEALQGRLLERGEIG